MQTIIIVFTCLGGFLLASLMLKLAGYSLLALLKGFYMAVRHPVVLLFCVVLALASLAILIRLSFSFEAVLLSGALVGISIAIASRWIERTAR